MRRLLLHPIHLLSLGFGTGLFPLIPGTVGTLIGVILYLYLQHVSLFWYLVVVTSLFLLGIRLCGITARAMETHDHPAIVWDEIIGFLVTMIGVPAGWGWIVAGFILFRFFDIAKPWPIKFIDSHVQGGLGIILDDLLAGIYGLGILHLVAFILE